MGEWGATCWALGGGRWAVGAQASTVNHRQGRSATVNSGTLRPPPAPLDSRIVEAVRIDALEGEGAEGGDAEAVLNHELGEALTSGDDWVLDAAHILEGVFLEAAGGHEDAFGGLIPGQCANELLDGPAPDGALRALVQL